MGLDLLHVFVNLDDPRSFQPAVDKLAEAGVLRRDRYDTGKDFVDAYRVVQPHKHEWRVVCCTSTRGGTADTVYVECSCGEHHTASNRLPIEVPE